MLDTNQYNDYIDSLNNEYHRMCVKADDLLDDLFNNTESFDDSFLVIELSKICPVDGTEYYNEYSNISYCGTCGHHLADSIYSEVLNGDVLNKYGTLMVYWIPKLKQIMIGTDLSSNRIELSNNRDFYIIEHDKLTIMDTSLEKVWLRYYIYQKHGKIWKNNGWNNFGEE